MKVLRRLTVPTGDILIVRGDHGDLECLSLGDYGREANVKCDAIGLPDAPPPVRHSRLLPLEEKWVVTISTQYGCSMGCTFCDVPKVGLGRNATHGDMIGQVAEALAVHPEVVRSDRLNIHFARMGEPTWNHAVLEAARALKTLEWTGFHVHPVVSTMMPVENVKLGSFIHDWMEIKNAVYEGNAGLQLSINSTDEGARREMFGGSACTLEEIAYIMGGAKPVGRKITLNFAVADWEIDPEILLRHFDPAHYIVKLTPMHVTSASSESGLRTSGDETSFAPYEDIEHALKVAGYDVLVFMASHEEDAGRITCGNAILSGSLPTCEYKEDDR